MVVPKGLNSFVTCFICAYVLFVVLEMQILNICACLEKKQVSDLFVVLLLSQSSYSHQKYVYSLLCVSDGQGHS